ncbi:hypothetical protein B0H67DRAFT_74916 [Lasiosphaeris hirsuta]|uniref:Uncharacterized protein n=1 Tax=Lasiosphaeris hirsuta TaxID=260670 RepID=A0AA40BBZ4_9PEZI|nr:hypothetical protein B0H67DRAFT_74916 [Lasiosphaeris hirsuta]
MASISDLPPELITKILLARFTQPPVCAFHLLAPGWNICQREYRELQKTIKVARVDTYIVPAKGHQGEISSTFDHEECDHIFLPVMEDPRKFEALSPFYHRELVREWASNTLIVVAQQARWVESLLANIKDTDCLLRSPETMCLLPYEEERYTRTPTDDTHSHSTNASDDVDAGKDRLPVLSTIEQNETSKFCFQLIRHLMLNTSPRLMGARAEEFGALPSTPATGITRRNVQMIEELLWSERKTWLELDWGRLERLETLFIDVRNYGSGIVEGVDADDLYEMAESLSGKNLKLLVIAGLRSYKLFPGVELLNIEEVERWETDSGETQAGRSLDGYNWWLVFRDAVRPGGKLVFVDKRVGELKLPVFSSWNDVP